MGYYIETSDGSTSNKADHFIKEHGAVEVTGTPDYLSPSTGSVLVCVVENDFFDAAAVAFSPVEHDRFLIPDNRKKRWLEMSCEVVAKLGPREYAKLLDL